MRRAVFLAFSRAPPSALRGRGGLSSTERAGTDRAVGFIHREAPAIRRMANEAELLAVADAWIREGGGYLPPLHPWKVGVDF